MPSDKESIIRSSIRSLCNALGAIIGVFLALILVVFAIGFISPSENLPQKSDLTIAPDAEGNRNILPRSSPVVLRINLKGVIGMDDLTGENFQNLLADSLDSPLGINRIQAIFLYVDTPGGTVTDSATIHDSLLAYKKKLGIPVYAFVDGICASGGMYICAAADKIYATESSVIGSIGVRMGPMFNVSELMGKIGVHSLTITEGKDKDALNPFRPWKPDEDASFLELIKQSYDQFLNVMTAGRPQLTQEKLREYGATVFSASTAAKQGYIDVADASYALAMKELTSVSHIGETPYQVVVLTTPDNFLSQLTQAKAAIFSGKIEHTLDLGPYMRPELQGKLLYLFQPQH